MQLGIHYQLGATALVKDAWYAS